MAEQRMRLLIRLGQRSLWWANRHDFVDPGLWLWTGATNRRVIPVPKRRLPCERSR